MPWLGLEPRAIFRTNVFSSENPNIIQFFSSYGKCGLAKTTQNPHETGFLLLPEHPLGFSLAFNYLGKGVLQVVVKVVQVEKEIPGGRF